MKVQILRSSREVEGIDPDKRLPRYFPGWFHERFGDHCVQISVDSTLKLKNAVRDVARTLRGYVSPDIEEWCREFDEPPQNVPDLKFALGYTDDADVFHPGSLESDEALIAYVNRYPKDWDLVKKCLGLTRQKGRHACARVIANRPVSEFIPITRVSGVPVTQFTAPSVEAVGGLKMDFLTVNSLKDIQDAIQLVQQRSGRTFEQTYINNRRVPAFRLVLCPDGEVADVWDLPEDQEVFKDVAEGRTETVFQFNTEGAQQLLVHFNRDRADGTKAIHSIEDMSAFTALDRPGPLDIKVLSPDWQGDPDDEMGKHNMLVEYARRAAGLEGSIGVLPILDKLVPETYGVMTYQEQLQRVYQELTGCDGAEAEEFRTNVAKKKPEKVAAAFPGWMERAGAKIGAEDAKKLWDFIETWGQYGFNKSHAVCYAVIAYACAYLKHYYPLEWWCAVLRNAEKDEINKKFWRYCKSFIELPDIQLSAGQWEIQGDKIRAPLSLLKGLGEKAHEQLVKYAPYKSLLDLAEKSQEHRKVNQEPVRQIEENGKKKWVKCTMDEYRAGHGDSTTTHLFKMRLGRNGIHRGIAHTLIVSGAMASLMPDGVSPDFGQALYDEAMLEVVGKTYKKSMEKIYPVLDSLGAYQARKAILPAYGEDLRPLLRMDQLPDVLSTPDKTRMRYHYKKWNRRAKREEAADAPVIGGKRLDALAVTAPPQDGGWNVGVIAFVEEVRPFRYPKLIKDKEAMELTLEVEGGKYKIVHWPDKKSGKLPASVTKIEPGDIVAALLTRYNPAKPFSCNDVRVVRTALNLKEEEDVVENSASA